MSDVNEYLDTYFGENYRAKALAIYGRICNRCDAYDIETALEVHHRDGDRQNNHYKNLEVLCNECHLREHGIEDMGV